MSNYKLKKGITALSGEKIDTLHFDFESLTPLDYRQIVRIEGRLKGVSVDNPQFEVSLGKKTSSEFRMASAWIAAVKGTKGLCVDDLDHISMLDLLELETEGILFFGDVA